MKRSFTLLVVSLLYTCSLFGASYSMSNSSQTIACGITHDFFDSNPVGNYGPNESFVMTFTPDVGSR